MNEIYINAKDFGEYFIGKRLEEEFNKDLISIEEIISYMEDLISEVEHWQEKYKDLQQDMEDNYKPIPVSEQYQVYNNDFI